MTVEPPGRRTGAVRADEPRRRRRGWLWLLLALLALVLLVALAVGLYLALRNGDDDGPASAPPSAAPPSAPLLTTASPGASGNGDDSGTAGGSGGAAGTSPSAGSGAGTATGGDAGGLVGGGAIPPVPAQEGTRLAVAGTFGTVLFAEDSAVLDERGQTVVADAVRRIRAAGTRQVLVTGYTDVVGGQPVNSTLSQQRADRVATALREQLGGAVAVTSAARGEADPVRPNDSAQNRQFNRRATIALR